MNRNLRSIDDTRQILNISNVSGGFNVPRVSDVSDVSGDLNVCRASRVSDITDDEEENFNYVNDKSVNKPILMDQDKHFLNENYLLYFHDPFDENWGKESYKLLHKIDTIESYWKITKLIVDKTDIGMFFLFREYIFPLWDDPLNINGGALSMKILKTDAFLVWEDLSSKFVSDNLLKTKNIEQSELINGISISP